MQTGVLTRQTLSGRKSLKEHPRWEQQVPILWPSQPSKVDALRTGPGKKTPWDSLKLRHPSLCPHPRGTYEPRSSCFQRVQAKRPGGNASEHGGCGTARGGRGKPHALVPGNRRGRSNLHRHRHPSLSVKSSHMALLTGKPGVSPSFKIDFWFRSVFGIIHPLPVKLISKVQNYSSVK